MFNHSQNSATDPPGFRFGSPKRLCVLVLFAILVLRWKPAAMCLSPPHGRHLLGGSSFFRPGPPSWLLRDWRLPSRPGLLRSRARSSDPNAGAALATGGAAPKTTQENYTETIGQVCVVPTLSHVSQTPRCAVAGYTYHPCDRRVQVTISPGGTSSPSPSCWWLPLRNM